MSEICHFYDSIQVIPIKQIALGILMAAIITNQITLEILFIESATYLILFYKAIYQNDITAFQSYLKSLQFYLL